MVAYTELQMSIKYLYGASVVTISILSVYGACGDPSVYTEFQYPINI